MSYQPKPIDTSRVQLPPALNDLAERLSENVHDVWAQKRLAEGWTHGPEKDAAQKKTPFLVPYSALPDSEKETDRVVVRNTLLAALALGCKITPPETLAPKPTAADEAALQAWRQHLDDELDKTIADQGR